MNLPSSYDCQVNCWKSGTHKSETDRVSKTLKKIEHILDWQPLTCCASAEIQSQATGRSAFLGAPGDLCWDAVHGRRVASIPESGRANESLTVCNVQDMPLDNSDDDFANEECFNEQKYLSFTRNMRKYGCVEREKGRRNTADARCGCGTAPVPEGLIQPCEDRKFQKTPRLPKSPILGYRSDIGQVNCRGNIGNNSDATLCLETNRLKTCISEAVHCCKKHTSIGKSLLAECCDKHRHIKSDFSSDVDRDSSKGVSLSINNNLARGSLQSHPRTSTNTKSYMSRGGNRRSSGDRVVPVALPDAPRSSEETEAQKTLEDFKKSSAYNRNSPSKDIRGSIPTDRDFSQDLANTKTSNKESKAGNPTPPRSTCKPTTCNTETDRRRTSGTEEQALLSQNGLNSSANEPRGGDRLATLDKPSDAVSDVPDQVPGTTATHERTARGSSTEADPANSKRVRGSHGTNGEHSLDVRPSTSPPVNGTSVKDTRRPNKSDQQTLRLRSSDKNDKTVTDDDDSLTTVSSEKSSSTTTSSEDGRRNPDADEFIVMLQNQATMICAVEAENRFLKSELVSVRRIHGSLVEENVVLHERLKHRLVDELLKHSEDIDLTQERHRRGSAFVLSLANSPQANENSAALCRLLKKYDFKKVKQELETLIRLHRIKSDRMEAQLKFSRSEIQRLEAEVTDLQRKLGREESFRLIEESTKNFAVGLCVRCCKRPATILHGTDANGNSHVKHLIKERDELIERLLSTKSVCSLAMDGEAELYAQFSSFVNNFETAQLEVLETLRQREELKDELNRVVDSTKGELRQEKLCWKKQMEVEQADSEERNTELVRKIEELMSEVENQRRMLNKSRREKDMLLEKCDSTNCRISRIESDYNKEIEELKTSLRKMTQERDESRNLLRRREHQLVTGRTANDQGNRGQETVTGVLEQFCSLESQVNSKVDRLQEYYGKALRDRDDVIQQQTTIIQKLKKKCCKVKRRLQKSRKKQNTMKPGSKNLPKKLESDEPEKPNTEQNSSDLKTEQDL